jgi:hypothetical protein
LRSTRDVGIDDCVDGSITRIRLWWATEDSRRYTAFPCNANHGVTAFDLPVGEVSLFVTPECADGNSADPAHFVAPPPIVRQVAVRHGGAVWAGRAPEGGALLVLRLPGRAPA